MQVLANRLDALGWDYRALSSAGDRRCARRDAAQRARDRPRGARPRQLGVPRAGLRAASRPGGDRLHGPVLGRSARPRPAARRRRVDDQAVPRRGADLRDRGGDPPPPPQRDARARGRVERRRDHDPARPLPGVRGRGEPRADRARVRDPAPARRSPTACCAARRSTSACGATRWPTATARSTCSCASCARSCAAASPQWSYIHTHFGVGYRFAPERDGARRQRRRALERSRELRPSRPPASSIRRCAPSLDACAALSPTSRPSLARARHDAGRRRRRTRRHDHSLFTSVTTR